MHIVRWPPALKGYLLGVFGSNQQLNQDFLASVAKKSEAEGITVYTRTEGGVRYCFLADASFPDEVQGYCRIAAICDYAYRPVPARCLLDAIEQPQRWTLQQVRCQTGPLIRSTRTT